jgi:hypothetical protein
VRSPRFVLLSAWHSSYKTLLSHSLGLCIMRT